MSTEVKPLLMDNVEVCRLLGVRPDTWRKRVEAGTAPLPHSRQGSRLYYRRSDVRYFLVNGLWPGTVKFRSLEVVTESVEDLSETIP